ncbi:PREDICTED: uncharacterized protein C9orf43 homolog [Dipodomys ordii]|uniref:Uncharacterized protein C9orf43 homolog n=1 Tax=Dipodomys ordii TaxID=10020 RepID=A0A1S3G9T4_DIPOR|nr:PREDICTED: uncharacterized protein C9orf43 homolog [Dipodomys ordii]
MNLMRSRSAMQSRQRLEKYRIGLPSKSLMVMNLPDDSQWDETTCDQAVCQHPQCWASIRRVERGHPRIMGAPDKSPLEAREKLPVLTIMNMSDSSLQTKRLANQQLSHFPYRKTSLSPGSKLKYKHSSRPQRLPNKNEMNQIKFPKLSILNFNGTELPYSETARNMVVVWIPKDVEKKEGLLPDVDRDVPCSEMKIQLAMMKNNLPLKKARPGSAISSKMFLTIHGLTLQRRSWQQPEYLMKSQKKEGSLNKQLPSLLWHQQQLQKRKAKISAKKQSRQKSAMSKDLLKETDKEAKIVSEKEKIPGDTTPSSEESALKLEQMEKADAMRLGSMANTMMDYFENYLSFFPSLQNIDVSDTEYFRKDSSPTKQESDYSYIEPSPKEQDILEIPVASQETVFTNFPENPSEYFWNPELKLLKIIQATAEEEEENQFLLQSEESLEA